MIVRAAATFFVNTLPRKECASPDLYTGQELRPHILGTAPDKIHTLIAVVTFFIFIKDAG